MGLCLMSVLMCLMDPVTSLLSRFAARVARGLRVKRGRDGPFGALGSGGGG